jgi:hypothetical protein
MELNFTGTIDEFHALFPTADASVLAQVTHALETLTVIGQKLESIMADLNQQTADIQVIQEALAQANVVLGNVSADTTLLLGQGATNAQRIADLEALVASLPGTVDTTALDAGIAAAKATAQVLLDGLTMLDNRVPNPAP